MPNYSKLDSGVRVSNQLNGTAIGILMHHWKSDSELIRDMIIERMNRLYVKSYTPRKDEDMLSEEERKAMAAKLEKASATK